MAKSINGSVVRRLQVEVENEESHSFKLSVPLVTNSRFGNVVNYKTYRLVNNSRRYKEKLASCTGKYVKRM